MNTHEIFYNEDFSIFHLTFSVKFVCIDHFLILSSTAIIRTDICRLESTRDRLSVMYPWSHEAEGRPDLAFFNRPLHVSY